MDLPKLIRLLPLLIVLLVIACGKKETETWEPNAASTYAHDLRDEIPPDELKPEQQNSDQQALQSYQYTWTGSEDMPDVVVIVDDFGNSGGALLEDFAKLPPEVVFAVLPDLSHTRQAGEIAAQYGHEVLIHTPMQAVSTAETPGKNYIRTDSSAEDISTLLASWHAQLPMASGANNHMGSAVTANRPAMTAVLNSLQERGLFFVDSVTTGNSVSPALARSLGYPALRRDIFLDVPDNTDATLAAKISSLGKYKGRREPVVIITHCHNRAKLEALQKFIAQIQAMGLNLTTLAQARTLSA